MPSPAMTAMSYSLMDSLGAPGPYCALFASAGTLPIPPRLASRRARVHPEHPGRVGRDPTRDRARRHRQGRSQEELSRPAAPGVVAVDRADRHLVLRLGHARPAADARAAAGVDHLDPGLVEDLEVALRPRVVAHALAAVLEHEPHPRRDAAAVLHGLLQDARVEVEV